MKILAEVTDHITLVRGLAGRRKSLGLTQLDVDDLAGLPSGYTGKIEISPTYGKGARGIGRESLGKLLDALGVKLVMVPKRPDNAAGKQSDLAIQDNDMAADYQTFFSERGRRMATIRWRKMTQKERERQIRKMHLGRAEKRRLRRKLHGAKGR